MRWVMLCALAVVAGLALTVPALSPAGRTDAEPVRPSAAQPLPQDALPDLRIEPVDTVQLAIRDGRRELRFSTEVANVGRGPLELISRPEDCDRDGDRSNDRTAYQAIRTRGGDERHVRAGCVIHHSDHGHWHFEGFARYTLEPVDDGRVAAVTDKVSFCLMDSDRVGDVSPEAQRYSDCGADVTQGISVGWLDRYGAALAGQSIDVGDVAPGRYRLVLHGDNENRLLELDERNNRTATLVELRADATGAIAEVEVIR
jgi:hypothetical protein